MKRKRFSVEQIAVLKQAELGMPVTDIIRQIDIAEQTFYRWKKQYAGLQSDQVRELKQLQDENVRLKKLAAGLSLEKDDFAGRYHKNLGRLALKQEAVDYIVSHYGLKLHRACKLMRQARSVQYYRSVKAPKQVLRQRMREIAHARIRYGYRRIHVLLKREGWQLGKNQHIGFTVWSNCSCARSCPSGARRVLSRTRPPILRYMDEC